MRRGAAIAALIVALAPCLTGSAIAGPPYQTDDPEPTPYRHYEIYVNSQFAHDRDELSGTFPSLEINYGLMPNVQFSVTASRVGIRQAGESWRTGFGDGEVALKVRFVQETATVPQVAFYPAVVFPSGDAKLGLGDGATKVFLPLWAQKSFGPWSVFGGGGVWRNPGLGKRDYTFSGIAAQRDVNEHLAFGVEVFHTGATTNEGATTTIAGRMPTVDGRATTGFGVGVIKGLDEHHKLLFSIGRSLDGTSAIATYAAYELYLGPKATKAPSPLLDPGRTYR